MNWLTQPWPWWLSGILIGLMVPALYLLAGKAFGISSSLRHIGSICTPNSQADYIKNHDWRKASWNLIFILGITVGGFVAMRWFESEQLALLPQQFFSARGLLQLAVGGLLVGFGARYAGGCTSGHAITGVSNLNWPSLVAMISFFVGGFITTWLIL